MSTQHPNVSIPNPGPLIAHGIERGTSDAIGWISSPVTKAVGEVEGFSLRLVNNFLNTAFYVLVAVGGFFLMFRGIETITGISSGVGPLVAARFGMHR